MLRRRPFAALAAFAFAFAFALLGLPAPALGADFPPGDGQRLVFLGDSITQQGLYVRYIDAYLLTRFPDRKVEVINLGLSSETAAGTSEPDHPFPRPDVHDRLARALGLARPDLLALCYGMNDGIYAPLGDDRFAAYRSGIESVVEAARKAGATVVVATPPPFDPAPIRAKVRPAGGSEYGYQHPFDGYDGVLTRYGEWLLSKRADGWLIADIHGATLGFLAAVRAEDPGFTLAGDGVHPGPDGHWLIARAYLDAWQAPADVDSAVIDARSGTASKGDVRSIARFDDSLAFSWTTRIPMAPDPKWTPRLVASERIDERFNRQILTVGGLDRPRYSLFEGSRKVGEATREELARGINLARFPELSTNRRAAEVFRLVAERAGVLGPAWLEAVGHGAPAMPRALPLDEAKRQAAPIEAKARELARPIPIELRLVPEGG